MYWYSRLCKWTPLEDSYSCSLLLSVAVLFLRRIPFRMDLQGQNHKIPKEGTGKLASHIHVDTINLWVNELSRLCQQIKL